MSVVMGALSCLWPKPRLVLPALVIKREKGEQGLYLHSLSDADDSECGPRLFFAVDLPPEERPRNKGDIAAWRVAVVHSTSRAPLPGEPPPPHRGIRMLIVDQSRYTIHTQPDGKSYALPRFIVTYALPAEISGITYRPRPYRDEEALALDERWPHHYGVWRKVRNRMGWY